MSFASFSKDYTENAFTSVENQFITKYLPEASGDAVRVYLYGLYLCSRQKDFDADAAAKLLRIPLDKIVEIFGFWEECGLVQVLSRQPLYVEYLPVSSAVGKPKPIRPEKYAEFNRELYRLLQRAGKDFKPYEMQRILEFLENNPIEQQAFLLIVEYCAKKDGAKLSAAHVINKAKKLVGDQKLTYEQVEADLADFNAHEKELSKIFTLLGVYRKPQDGDYDFLEKWLAAGMELGALYACAETLKKGSLPSLDLLVTELGEHDAKTEADAREYLARREELVGVVFQVARRLGVKIQNPRAYVEEYAEPWLDRGYDADSLSLVASLCLRLSYGFPEMDAFLAQMYTDGVVDGESVKKYCQTRNTELKLLQRIQELCGVVKKTQAALLMIETWKKWNFSDEMILEAARRSTNAANPLPYINKLLSEWKRLGAYAPSEIPAQEPPVKLPKTLLSETAAAADERSERERFYAARREQAMRHAERARAIAAQDGAFAEADGAVRRAEIELAKAEIYSPERVPNISARIEEAKARRAEALARLRLTEHDFLPRYHCTKCSDTGFLPDGRACDCYKRGSEKTERPL